MNKLFACFSSCLLLWECLGQQFPTRSVPTFSTDPALKQRQDVCERYEQYDRREIELRQALQDLQLRILLRDGGFMNIDESGAIDLTNPGLAAVLLDEVAFRAGFTWRDSFGLGDFPLENDNRTWTDFLTWATDYYDVVGPIQTRTLERLKLGMGFPEGYSDSSFILVGLRGEASGNTGINLWSWLAPFDLEVWICILVTVVVSGIIYAILDYIPPKYQSRLSHRQLNPYSTPTINHYMQSSPFSHPQPQSGRSPNIIHPATSTQTLYEGANTLGEYLFLSSLLLTQNFQFMPRTPASRLFSVSMAFWALLISANYTANLASYFVVENSPSQPIQSIEEAIQANAHVCVSEGSSIHGYIEKSYPQATLFLTDGTGAVFQHVREGDCAVGVTYLSSFQQIQRQREHNPDCNLEWVGRVLDFRQGGFVVKVDSGILCTSLVNDVFNLHLTEMKDDGFIKQAWQEELSKLTDIDCSADNSEDETSSYGRSLKEMGGTFLLHLTMGILGFVLMAFDRIYNRCIGMSNESRRELVRSITRASVRKGDDDIVAALQKQSEPEKDNNYRGANAYDSRNKRGASSRGNKLEQGLGIELFRQDWDRSKGAKVSHHHESICSDDAYSVLHRRIDGLEQNIKSILSILQQQQLHGGEESQGSNTGRKAKPQPGWSTSEADRRKLTGLKERAVALNAAGDIAGAKAALEKARELEFEAISVEDLSDPLRLEQLAVVRKKQGDLKTAKRAIRKAQKQK